MYFDLDLEKLCCGVCKASRVFLGGKSVCGYEIGLQILPDYDSWSLKISWETFCSAISNPRDLEMVSTQCCTEFGCSYDCFVVSSSSTTASYQDLIGLVARMVEDLSFVEGCGLSSFVGWVWGAFPLSLDFALKGIRTCFEGIHGLENQGWNLNLL